MKRLLIVVLAGFLTATASAQNGKGPAVDKSTMDMSYYPSNYPVLKIQGKAAEPLLARVIYSRPQRNGRKVFGELVEFNKVWRLGANEATEVEFYKDVSFNGKPVKKGRYTLYAIPLADKWTLILNKDLDTWGAFKYDPSKDVLRTDVKPEKLNEPSETFSIFFDKMNRTTAAMYISWDDTRVTVPIGY